MFAHITFFQNTLKFIINRSHNDRTERKTKLRTDICGQN